MGSPGTHHLVFFSDCPYYGGAEGYLGMLAEAAPAGWRISAIVPAGKPGEILARRFERAGAEVLRFRKASWTSPALWSEVRGHLARLGGDRLHLNLPSVYDACLSVPAVLAKRAGYRRVVSTEHLPMVARARRRVPIKLAMTTAIDAIIVNTAWNRDRLAHYHHVPLRKIVIIPNGSAESPALAPEARRALRAGLGAADDDVVLAIVARLTERKGHRFLFAALQAIAREEPERRWRLWVVGDGEEREQLGAQAEALGLAGRISFLGHRDDVREVIHACDLMVLPSLLETQPFVLTEAMASARPIVTTAIYGIPEIVADGVTGCLVPPGEVPPLTRAVARLMAEPETRRRMGEAGRRRYEERFTVEMVAARTYGVIAGASGNGRAASGPSGKEPDWRQPSADGRDASRATAGGSTEAHG